MVNINYKHVHNLYLSSEQVNTLVHSPVDLHVFMKSHRFTYMFMVPDQLTYMSPKTVTGNMWS